jgi:hypothetical protein
MLFRLYTTVAAPVNIEAGMLPVADPIPMMYGNGPPVAAGRTIAAVKVSVYGFPVLVKLIVSVPLVELLGA